MELNTQTNYAPPNNPGTRAETQHTSHHEPTCEAPGRGGLGELFPEPQCPHCGSDKDPYFSRVEPMGYFCEDCGRDVSEPTTNLLPKPTDLVETQIGHKKGGSKGFTPLERPTPETDAMWRDTPSPERDEAREKLSQAQVELLSVRHMFQTVCEERDEARAKNEKMRKALERITDGCFNELRYSGRSDNPTTAAISEWHKIGYLTLNPKKEDMK